MKKSRHKKIFSRKSLRTVLVLLVVGFIGYQAWTWPKVSRLRTRNPEATAFIELYKTKQKKAGKKAYVKWKWAAYSEISDNLKRAALVSEDINFFSHRGFDFEAVNEAVQDAVKDQEKPRGASTISQQVVKNLWLSPSRNYSRKLKEAILTLQLEWTLPKKRILEIYLNVAEFGPGIYGAEAASRHYFQKHASELSEREAAQLAASLPLPRYWHPDSKSKYYSRRVDLVRERMQTMTFINKYI